MLEGPGRAQSVQAPQSSHMLRLLLGVLQSASQLILHPASASLKSRGFAPQRLATSVICKLARGGILHLPGRH